jgi:two-component system cell cycle response regulator
MEKFVVARILVVDDVAHNVRLLEEILVAAYYEVKATYDGLSVVALAQDWQPDVILLDVLMPGLGGYEVCGLLKANPDTCHIPVIMVTALRDSLDRLLAIKAGADEFISKPLDRPILQARLRSVIRLKRLMDDLRAQGAVAVTLGLADDSTSVISVGSCNVLVIDDGLNFGPRLEEALGYDGSMVVVEAHESGVVDRVRATAFDLIIISLQLSMEDPLRLLARLRATEGTRDAPILLITEEERRDQLIAGLDLGASDCLMLPIDDTELVLRVRSHIRRKRYQDRLRSDLGSAVQLAVIDPLTGLYNRRYLMNFLNDLFAKGSNPKVALLLADVDHFKSINDRFGHQFGDLILKNVAKNLRARLRTSDLVVRYGGEEFIIVVTNCTDEGAVIVAERLRLAVELAKLDSALHLTISVGVALPCSADSAEKLIEHADRALYKAKREGRNRVGIEHSSPSSEEKLRNVG